MTTKCRRCQDRVETHLIVNELCPDCEKTLTEYWARMQEEERMDNERRRNNQGDDHGV